MGLADALQCPVVIEYGWPLPDGFGSSSNHWGFFLLSFRFSCLPGM